MSLLVRLVRVSNERHVFEAVRDDGGVERLELETRSFLLHDLVHFALESEGGLSAGFYVKLARGESYQAGAEMFAGETGRIEKVVAMLQGAVSGKVDARDFTARARGAFENLGEDAPDWLDAELIQRTLERLRQLRGRWRATAFGDAMEITFSGGS